MADLHARGVRVVGGEGEAPLTARQTDLRGPIAIVVGSEGHGLSPAVRRRCDALMRIPMRGTIASLNAAVAGSILVFEAVAQRDPDGRRAAPVAPNHPIRRRPRPMRPMPVRSRAATTTSCPMVHHQAEPAQLDPLGAAAYHAPAPKDIQGLCSCAPT
jgi:hypothetical protein